MRSMGPVITSSSLTKQGFCERCERFSKRANSPGWKLSTPRRQKTLRPALLQFSTVIESSQQKSVDGTAKKPSARIVSIQRWSIGLLVAGGALNYIDRATLSVANKLIQDELGIPVAKMGLLL